MTENLGKWWIIFHEWLRPFEVFYRSSLMRMAIPRGSMVSPRSAPSKVSTSNNIWWSMVVHGGPVWIRPMEAARSSKQGTGLYKVKWSGHGQSTKFTNIMMIFIHQVLTRYYLPVLFIYFSIVKINHLRHRSTGHGLRAVHQLATRISAPQIIIAGGMFFQLCS